MDIFEAFDEVGKAQAEHDDFDAAIADDAHLERHQAAHDAYMRTLFPNLDESCLRFVLWAQPTIQGVCL
jgi:hypothetical protein